MLRITTKGCRSRCEALAAVHAAPRGSLNWGPQGLMWLLDGGWFHPGLVGPHVLDGPKDAPQDLVMESGVRKMVLLPPHVMPLLGA